MTELTLSTKEGLSVVIVHNATADKALIAEICLGLEEEGVPALAVIKDGTALELAAAGASASTLGVGIGVDGNGASALTHFRMPPNTPVFQVSADTGAATTARILGVNGARLVKGDPFEFWGPGGAEIQPRTAPPSWESLTRNELPNGHEALVREITAAVIRTLAAS